MEVLTHQQERSLDEMLGGSLSEGIAGAGAIVLTVLALVHVLPDVLASVAAIAIGVGLMIGGGTIAGQYTRLLRRTESRETSEHIGGGMAAESMFGLAGIVLGILALLRLSPTTLLAVSAVVFGAGLLIASSATARFNSMILRNGADPARSHEVAREAVYAASGFEVVIGVGVLILGVLALCGISPAMLTFVALLSAGAGLLCTGSSMSGRLFGVFAH